MSEIPISNHVGDGETLRLTGIWATGAYMLLYIIRPWETLIPELASLSFERVAYLIILLTVMGSTGLRWRVDGPVKGLMVFTTALCISAIAAYDPSLSWSAPDGLYVYLTKLLAAILIISVVRTPTDLMYLVMAAVTAITLYAGKSLWEYTIHGAGRWSMGVLRLRGINDTFGHANAICAVLAPTLPWWLFLYRSRPQLTAGWSVRMTRSFNLFLWIAVCTFVACILLSGSRAGFSALVTFGFLGWLGAAGSRIKMGFLIVVVGLITWSLLDKDHEERIRSLWDDSAAVAGGQESKEGRLYALQAGLRMFRQHPIAGVGIANFGVYRARYDDGAKVEAHSIPAQLLGETGLIGAIAFVYFLWTLYRATRTLNNALDSSEDETTQMLSNLGTALRQSMILLLVLGLGSHLAYLFTWIWIAAFLSCALSFRYTALVEPAI